VSGAGYVYLSRHFTRLRFARKGSALPAGRPKKLFLLSPLLVPDYPLRR